MRYIVSLLLTNLKEPLDETHHNRRPWKHCNSSQLLGRDVVEPSNQNFCPSRYTLLGAHSKPSKNQKSTNESTSKLSFQLEHESWYCCSALRRKRRGHDCVTNKTHANPSLTKNIHGWNVEGTTPAPQNKRAQTQRNCGKKNLRTQMLRVSQKEAATQQFKPARTSNR